MYSEAPGSEAEPAGVGRPEARSGLIVGYCTGRPAAGSGQVVRSWAGAAPPRAN